MPYKNPPPCQICGKPSAARKMCDKHYRRWMKFGNVDATKRPDDWGKRHKHPLWHSWKWTAREGRVKAWDDFWTFVSDVGERPSEHHKLRRYRSDVPFGPQNTYWADQIILDEEKKKDNALRQREWAKRNPLKCKSYELKRRFGIGAEEYTSLLEKQGGKCAICGGEDEWFSLAVDHCHDKKHIRGLLCSRCNRGLGLFRESPEWLRKAAEYIEGTKRLL